MKMIRNYVDIPKYLNRMSTLKTGYVDYAVIGGDTETGFDLPLLLQFHNGCITKVIEVDEYNVMDRFFDYLKSLPRGKYVLFFHNLGYDIPMLFYPIKKLFTHDESVFKYDGFRCRVIYSKCIFGQIRNKSKTIRLIDSYQFFKGSLKNLCKYFKLKHQKLKPPENLGKTRTIDEYFLEYAKQDARCQYDLGKFIMNYHQEYNIKSTVSIAQYSANLFRKHYINNDVNIMLPDKEVIDAAVKSYHGGLNIFSVKDAPTKIRDVYEIDINSAYPYAMTQIPNMNNALLRKTDDFIKDKEGIYKITGYAENTDYPIIFKHNFDKLNDTYFNDTWITSYELKEALRTGSISIDEIEGYVIEEREDEYNPFDKFAKDFYDFKQNTPKDNPKYLFYKTVLNSLYGKTIQGVSTDGYSIRTRLDANGIRHIIPQSYRAGGLFNPIIATLITGFVRAYLRKYAIKYKALDTSTDSIKTVVEPYKEDLGNDLGQWSIDHYGDCIFLRNKLYIHIGDRIKWGLHGFRGTKEQLLRAWIEKKPEYTYKRMIKLKESYIRTDNYLPLSFIEEKAVINVF